jgi:hypothetical protein
MTENKSNSSSSSSSSSGPNSDNIDSASNTQIGDGKKRRLSRWFVSNQKTVYWDRARLNHLHITIIFLLLIIYILHVVGSPFLKIINDDTAIVIIRIVQTICLLASIACLIKMCCVNGSIVATKMILGKQNVRTYVFIFWALRSFIIEILKGQYIYSFIHVFHSIAIYSTDIWYMCNQKTLILNMLMFLTIITYELFISISPIASLEPAWQFMNVKITANSLSRSNQFNLFVIFFDALLVLIFDPKRSRYVMIVKKQKRDTFEMLIETKKKIDILVVTVVILVVIGTALFVLHALHYYATRLFNSLFGIIAVFGFAGFCKILYHSSQNAPKIVLKLLVERRVVFVLILLGIGFYVDCVFRTPTAASILFPLIMICFIAFDLIAAYFPKRAAKFLLGMIVLSLFFNIFNHTFLKDDCEEDKSKLDWGIFSEKISYCTISRLVYQTMLSLLMSPLIATLTGRTDNLFFCNANVYRSTGTIYRAKTNTLYVNHMRWEQRKSIKELAQRLSLREINNNSMDKEENEEHF